MMFCQFLVNRVTATTFGTTLLEDNDILKRGDVTPKLTAALMFRMYKKRLLIRNLQWLRLLRDVLEGSADAMALLRRGNDATWRECCSLADIAESTWKDSTFVQSVLDPVSLAVAVSATVSDETPTVSWMQKDYCVMWAHHITVLRRKPATMTSKDTDNADTVSCSTF